MSITPAECIDCKLCATSCPFDAIEQPTSEKENFRTESNIRRFLTYVVLIPVLMFIGGFLGSKSHVFLSNAHPDVYLAELLITHPELKNDEDNIDVQTFLSSGKTMETLVEEAKVIRGKFKLGGWLLGAFMGLVIGLTLLNQVVFRRREGYEANKGDCYSCGRCMDYCPVGKEDHPYFLEGKTV